MTDRFWLAEQFESHHAHLRPWPTVNTSTRALVNGIPGAIAWGPDGRPFAVISATVAGGRIVSINVPTHPDRLRRLDLDPVAD